MDVARKAEHDLVGRVLQGRRDVGVTLADWFAGTPGVSEQPRQRLHVRQPETQDIRIHRVPVPVDLNELCESPCTGRRVPEGGQTHYLARVVFAETQEDADFLPEKTHRIGILNLLEDLQPAARASEQYRCRAFPYAVRDKYRRIFRA
jgi:hypothetical protein